MTSVPRTVHIVIGCDTDPDREGMIDGVPAGTLAWRGMTEGIPALKRSLQGVRDAVGREPVFTWLLRADEQIRAVHGEYGAVARTHAALLRGLEGSGDELGWHPHFWRRRSAGDPWAQEVDDVAWQVDMLRRAHEDLAASLPSEVRSVRMGWDYHNDETFRTLEELGISIDFSAIPGMRTYTGTPPAGGENLFDWHTSPRAPYRPSVTDYRRAAEGSERSRTLLEVPNFVSTSRGWSLLGGLQLARKTRNVALLWQAVRRPTYWINITARRALFAPLVAELRRTLRKAGAGPLVFATYFHPDELLPNHSRMYDLPSVRDNLEELLRACAELKVPARFARASEIPALVSVE